MLKQKGRAIEVVLLTVVLLVNVALAVAQTKVQPAQGEKAATAAAPGVAVRPRGHGGVRSGTRSPSQSPRSKPEASPTPVPPPAPVSVISQGQPEYLSGEANVSVKGNQNPIIRLGLAQNGVNIIEFPATDRFFMIHPGNSELVSFDEVTAKLSRRSLVLRPGAAFVAPPAGSGSRVPSASISVQMQSGVVITFLIYPVRELAQNAHRCVVMYNRDEVIAARRAAGLAVNLDNPQEPPPSKPKQDTVRFGKYGDEDVDGDGSSVASGVDSGSRGSVLMVDVDSARADERARAGKSSKKKPKVSEVANRALKELVKSPSKMGAYSKPIHGLSLAVAPALDLDVQTRMVVVAVRNESKAVLRLVPGSPELYIQTFDDHGKTLQIEQVKRVHVESTSLEGKVSGGEVSYFAIVYEAPIIGARQRLRVSVSQTEAADEPATTALRSEGQP